MLQRMMPITSCMGLDETREMPSCQTATKKYQLTKK